MLRLALPPERPECAFYGLTVILAVAGMGVFTYQRQVLDDARQPAFRQVGGAEYGPRADIPEGSFRRPRGRPE
jgi:hypothetical protein